MFLLDFDDFLSKSEDKTHKAIPNFLLRFQSFKLVCFLGIHTVEFS